MKQMATRRTAEKVVFGSCQERKMFPTHCAPNRMSIELPALPGSSQLGPGCYQSHEVGTILYELERRPESKTGYILGARTAARFRPSFQTVTPSPQKYQQDWSVSSMGCPGKTSFHCTTPRFSSKAESVSFNPGPGTYALDTTRNRKVSWPMMFGSPDWSKMPSLRSKALHTELFCDKQLKKRRNREAYLSLYYS